MDYNRPSFNIFAKGCVWLLQFCCWSYCDTEAILLLANDLKSFNRHNSNNIYVYMPTQISSKKDQLSTCLGVLLNLYCNPLINDLEIAEFHIFMRI